MVKFTPQVKLALRKAKAGKISKSQAAKSLNISRKTLYVLLKGHTISKTKKDSVARKILGIVVANPSLGPAKIANILKRNEINLSQKSVWLVLKKLNLGTSALRKDYSFNFAKPSQAKDNESPVHLRLLPDARKRMIENREPAKFKVSRKTYSKWNKRYQKASGGDLNIIESLSDAYLKGSLHPRGVGSELEAAILSLVASNPEYSSHMIAQKLNTVGNHGVQRVLERNGLSRYGMRKAYALTHAESPVAPAPVAGVFGRVRSVFETFVPNLAPAPPPSRSVLVKTFAISLLSTLLISFTAIWWISVVASAPGFVASIGMIFALIALGFGMFFFIYSLKYYISLAIVLSRSQNEGLEGNERPTAPGLRSDLDNIKMTSHPFVSVQVALYNEKNVVERLAKSITSFDYPNYEAMLVDDSNDETSDKITAFQKTFLLKGEELKITKGDGWTLTEVGVKEGVTLKHLHRTSREGYKGGALALALTLVDKRTEYISIFDADFVPYTDSLSLFLKYFQLKDDPKTAAVQGYQWHVLNKSENWITRGVRSEYSGSYVIERAGTEIYGGLKQISGSVYMIKRKVLEEIGWGTSITEDFELTLKLYQKGYKVIYTPYIQAPAECVSTLRRLIRQRMRWAEGHSFNIKKMLVSLLASPKLSVPEKFETIYLAPYYLQAMFFLVGTMCWLIAETVFRVRLPFWTELWGWSLVLTNMISLPLLNSVGLFLEESEQKDYSGIPSFIALSYVVVPFQAYAAVKGFLEKEEGPWFRTPKTGKVTDIFTRNKFYRFIQGIIPGGAQGSNQSLSSALSPYLALATANNRFDRFDIRRQKNRRWIGKAVISTVLMVSILVNSFAFGVRPVKAAGWYDNNWLYRVKLTIDHTKVGADQTDFPVYVDLANMPAGFHTNVNQTDARDIRVTKDDGTTELPREVVFYTAASNIGELHFKYTGTLSSSTDTDVYIYYGNSAASDYAITDTYGAENVWDSNYADVQHFKETSGNHLDSTTVDSDATTVTVTQQGANIGKMYLADEYDGTNDYLGTPTNTSLGMSGDATVEAWVKLDGLPSTRTQEGTVLSKASGATFAYKMYVSQTNDKPFFAWTNTTPTSYYTRYDTALTTGVWYHLVGVKDGSTLRFYFNGSTTGTVTGSPTGTIASNPASQLRIGGTNIANFWLDGFIDEVRFSSSVRSATWISTEYNNQSSPSTFFSTWGAEESVPELTILLFPIALGVPFIVKYMRRRKEQALAYA